MSLDQSNKNNNGRSSWTILNVQATSKTVESGTSNKKKRQQKRRIVCCTITQLEWGRYQCRNISKIMQSVCCYCHKVAACTKCVVGAIKQEFSLLPFFFAASSIQLFSRLLFVQNSTTICEAKCVLYSLCPCLMKVSCGQVAGT